MAAEPTSSKTTSSVRVVVTGALQAGKTTFIRTLSDIPVLTAQQAMATGPDGEESVPLDFGRMSLQEGLDVQLFGAPGVGALHALDQIVGPELMGVIMLFGHDQAEALSDSVDIAHWLRDTWSLPWVVGVTHVGDADPNRAVNRARHALRLPEHVNISCVDARVSSQTRRLLLDLFDAARPEEAASEEG